MARLTIFIILFLTNVFACGEPQNQVEDFTEKVQQIVVSKDLSKQGKINRIKEKMDQHVDMTVFTRQVVGRKYWTDATEPQKKELVSLVFNDLVKDYSEIFLKEAVRDPHLAPYRKKDGRYQVVDVNYSDASGKTIKVSYAVFCKKDNWKIFDLSVNGVHLSALQKSQYKDALQKGGVGALISYLKRA